MRRVKMTDARPTHLLDFIGARDRNRTCDLRVTSALLYRLSYTGVGLNLALTLGAGNLVGLSISCTQQNAPNQSGRLLVQCLSCGVIKRPKPWQLLRL